MGGDDALGQMAGAGLTIVHYPLQISDGHQALVRLLETVGFVATTLDKRQVTRLVGETCA